MSPPQHQQQDQPCPLEEVADSRVHMAQEREQDRRRVTADPQVFTLLLPGAALDMADHLFP